MARVGRSQVSKFAGGIVVCNDARTDRQTVCASNNNSTRYWAANTVQVASWYQLVIHRAMDENVAISHRNGRESLYLVPVGSHCAACRGASPGRCAEFRRCILVADLLG